MASLSNKAQASAEQAGLAGKTKSVLDGVRVYVFDELSSRASPVVVLKPEFNGRGPGASLH